MRMNEPRSSNCCDSSSASARNGSRKIIHQGIFLETIQDNGLIRRDDFPNVFGKFDIRKPAVAVGKITAVTIA